MQQDHPRPRRRLTLPSSRGTASAGQLPTHPRPPASGPGQPAGSQAAALGGCGHQHIRRPGHWARAHPRGEGQCPAAFRSAGPDPGSCHARQLHLLPHGPQETGCCGDRQLPAAPPHTGDLEAGPPSGLAPASDLGASPGLSFLSSCCGPNAWVPTPQILVEAQPQGDGTKKQGLWGVIRS